ncbi:MAG: radical SAM protein [Myxococcota bacterium]
MGLDLRVGYRCNNRCRFCDQAGRAGEASLDAIVGALRAHRGDAVWLAGGEITLRPDLPRLVAAAREAGYGRVGLQTNGRVLAVPGAAKSLRDAGLTDVAVAIHAATAELHDWLTREPGSFRQAVLGARRSREAGLELRVSSVTTRSNTDDLPRIARLAVELGAGGHRWHACKPGGEDRALVPRFARLARPLADALDVARDARAEADTAGVPLCFLPGHLAAAADRLDAPAPDRLFPVGEAEPPVPRGKGPPCVGCPLAHVCAGPYAGYVARWGWDEFVAPGGSPAPVPDPAVLDVAPDETTRSLRQRLVRVATAKTVVFAGPDPWAHPGLPTMVREAVRLGIPRVEVWGPLRPLEDAAFEKLAGLAEVRAPAGGDARTEERLRRMGCVVAADPGERQPPSAPRKRQERQEG